VRLLHARDGAVRQGLDRRRPRADGGRRTRRPRRLSLPLHGLREARGGGDAGGGGFAPALVLLVLVQDVADGQGSARVGGAGLVFPLADGRGGGLAQFLGPLGRLDVRHPPAAVISTSRTTLPSMPAAFASAG